MERQLAELRRKLEEAEARAAEEQRRREEEQRLREEEQRLREEEQRLREEEQRRREAAEADAARSQPTTLIAYLETCHELSLALEAVTDETSTTKGSATDPAGRQHPRRIIPWHDFLGEQEEIWEQFSVSRTFRSDPLFPSSHQLDYVRNNLQRISAEIGLRQYAHETVENPVRTLVEAVYNDEQLRSVLGLQGKVVFESHTNMGQQSKTSIEEEMEHMSIDDRGLSKQTRGRAKGKGRKVDKDKGKDREDSSKSGARRRGGMADQFCIYELGPGQKALITSIEYKAPHKLPLDNIIAGLDGEIRPAEELINKEDESFEFSSKYLVAAVITQAFSDMVRKGVRWGYVYTGQAVLFLHIPDDPSVVYYHLSIPREDYQQNDANRLYRTAVAQVFAFVLRASRAEGPSQSWHDKAEALPTWPLERVDVLANIPATAEKKVRYSAYRSSRVNGFLRSPIATRSRGLPAACKESTTDSNVGGDDTDAEGDDAPASPTPPRRNRRGGPGKPSTSAKRGGASSGKGKPTAGGRKQAVIASRQRIEERPYCTQRCLRGLAFDEDLDERCPNFQDHKGKHIDPGTFLRLIRRQLATDRGSDADCKALFMKGSRGALFKVRLSSHGYTLVAKGMEKAHLYYLKQEQRVYDHVRSIQGEYVPVCLGSARLKLPYYYDGGVYISMLFLSWAGRPLRDHLHPRNEGLFHDKMTQALQALHDLQVLQNDPALRNWLYDEGSERVMIVDFERAEIRARQVLATITPNRKRKRSEGKQTTKDDFSLEMRLAQSYVSKFVRP